LNIYIEPFKGSEVPSAPAYYDVKCRYEQHT